MARKARPENRMVPLSVKVIPEVFAALEAELRRLGITRSEWLARAVTEKLDRDSALREARLPRAVQMAPARPESLAQGLYQCPSCHKSSEGPGECRACLGKPRDLSALMAHRGTPEEQARWALEYQESILAGRIVPPAPGDGLRDGDVKGAPGPGAQPPGC